MHKQKVSLVTGGAGFIGSHVADSLFKMGHKVVILDDLSGGSVSNLNTNHTFIKGSICDEPLLDRIFKEYKFNYIYHLAAHASEYFSHFSRKEYYENNVIGSVNLITCSIKNQIEHFIFTSSIAVYGARNPPLLETYCAVPKDPYGITKLAMELDLQAAAEMFGINYTIFRPHNVYGPRQDYRNPQRNVVGIFINSILQGNPMPIYGSGMQTRSFTFIEDIAPYIAKSVLIKEAKNEIINIGANEYCTVIELAQKIAKIMGSDCRVHNLPERSEVFCAYSDHTKFKKIFNVSNETNFDAGLKKTIEWIRQQETEKSN